MSKLVAVIQREVFADPSIHQLFMKAMAFIDVGGCGDVVPFSFRCDYIDNEWIGTLEFTANKYYF